MKIIVTGATGTPGTSVVRALGDAAEVDEVVGIACRRPAWEAPKTSWTDAVIHLAWAIRPSRDEATFGRINREGSRSAAPWDRPSVHTGIAA